MDAEMSRKSIYSFKGGVGKKFDTYVEAVEALNKGPAAYGVSDNLSEDDKKKIKAVYEKIKEVKVKDIKDKKMRNSQIGVNLERAFCVDASRYERDGVFIAEYQIKKLDTLEVIYVSGEYKNVDNNLAEFFAVMKCMEIIHKEKMKGTVIFTDSAVALNWIGEKAFKVSMPMEKDIEEDVKRALKILKTYVDEYPVLKWQTQIWGENPADFGRK